MGIKPVSGPRCLKHQIECLYNCGWCAKPICDECVEYAGGKKYCDKCWAKKQQMTPAQDTSAAQAPRPRVAIRNVDPSLDPQAAEKKRVENEKRQIELPNKKKVDPSVFEI